MITASIIVPTYRRPKLLLNCIKALLLQNFDKSRYEIIIVSDGPDEDTCKAITGLARDGFPALRYFYIPKKKGPAAARNYGWLNARGEIIAFTDDDCIPNENWLQHMVNNCTTGQDMAITGKVIVPVSKKPTDYEFNTLNLEIADFITANCACTKSALVKTGGFDEQFSMAWREDSDFEFKLISNNIPVKKVIDAVVTHPVRKSKWGISIQEQKKTQYDALLYKKYPGLFRKKIRAKPPVLYYAIITSFILMITGYIIKHQQLAIIGLGVWLGLTVFFILKRLLKTRLSISHIAEMVVTSVVIPFLSIFWQWYGAVKYRVLFI